MNLTKTIATAAFLTATLGTSAANADCHDQQQEKEAPSAMGIFGDIAKGVADSMVAGLTRDLGREAANAVKKGSGDYAGHTRELQRGARDVVTGTGNAARNTVKGNCP